MEKQDTTKWIGLLIVGFLAVLIGTVIITESSQEVVKITDRLSATQNLDLNALGCYDITLGQVNESSANCNITLTYAPTGWKSGGECPLTTLIAKNKTGETTLTLNTDYFVNLDTGLIGFKNTTTTNMTNLGNVSVVTYKYCGDGHQSGWGATMLNMVPGFVALAILMAVAFLIVWILKREGVVV
jgi:hypothetical protein